MKKTIAILLVAIMALTVLSATETGLAMAKLIGNKPPAGSSGPGGGGLAPPSPPPSQVRRTAGIYLGTRDYQVGGITVQKIPPIYSGMLTAGNIVGVLRANTYYRLVFVVNGRFVIFLKSFHSGSLTTPIRLNGNLSPASANYMLTHWSSGRFEVVNPRAALF